jgi:hypothetical protein
VPNASTLRSIVYVLILAAAVAALYRCGSDPRRTRLPFGSTDLSGVQAPLAKLSPEERELVEDYVERSRGDVVPAAFGDPDMPLTARTFGEAIELERAWRQNRRTQAAASAARGAERDAKLAPLRALVEAEIASAEVLTQQAWMQRRDPGAQAPADLSDVFVVAVRLRNLGDQPVSALRGALDARDVRAYLPMDLCWIEIGQERTIPPGGEIEAVCASRPGDVNEQKRAFAAFVAGTPGRFEVIWEPRYIKLADGREYDAAL